ncbi:MAG TPA: MFS transporter [Fimbriimonas sp.]
MAPTPADRRARVAVSLIFFVLGAALGAWAPHIATVKINLELSSRTLGFALLAGTMGAVTTMPFSGFLIHHIGSRGAVVATGFGLLFTLPLLVAAPSLASFAAVLYVMGIFYGQFDVAMNTQSLIVQARYRKPVLSAIHGFYSIGGFAAGAAYSIAAKLHATPVAHLVANSVVLALLLLASALWLYPKSLDRLDQGEGPKFAIPKGVLLPIGFLTMFSFLGEGALWDWAAVYLRTSMGASAAVAGIGFGVFGLGMAIGRFLGDPIVGRFGTMRVLAFSGLISALGLVASVSVPTPAAAVIGFALAGLGLANLVPILFAAAGRQPGFSPAYGLAAVTTLGYTGFLLGPPVIGLVADAWTLGASLGLVAVLCAIVAIYGPRFVREQEIPSEHTEGRDDRRTPSADPASGRLL